MEKICLTEKELCEALCPNGEIWYRDPTLDQIKRQALRLNAFKECGRDENLESLIAIGEACIKSGFAEDNVLWCTTNHHITVKSLLDLKKYRCE